MDPNLIGPVQMYQRLLNMVNAMENTLVPKLKANLAEHQAEVTKFEQLLRESAIITDMSHSCMRVLNALHAKGKTKKLCLVVPHGYNQWIIPELVQLLNTRFESYCSEVLDKESFFLNGYVDNEGEDEMEDIPLSKFEAESPFMWKHAQNSQSVLKYDIDRDLSAYDVHFETLLDQNQWDAWCQIPSNGDTLNTVSSGYFSMGYVQEWLREEDSVTILDNGQLVCALPVKYQLFIEK